MSQNSFAVVFNGKLVEGAEIDQVKRNVAALFKVDVAKVERLFSGATVAIKKGVDEQTATKYRAALHKAGAICRVVDTAAKATPAQEAPSKSSALEGAVLDAPGTVLVEHEEVAAPQIDTSGMSMDAVGAELTEHEEVAPLQVDTSSMRMDEPGVTLVEHEETPEPEIDTSRLSLD